MQYNSLYIDCVICTALVQHPDPALHNQVMHSKP